MQNVTCLSCCSASSVVRLLTVRSVSSRSGSWEGSYGK